MLKCQVMFFKFQVMLILFSLSYNLCGRSNYPLKLKYTAAFFHVLLATQYGRRFTKTAHSFDSQAIGFVLLLLLAKFAVV